MKLPSPVSLALFAAVTTSGLIIPSTISLPELQSDGFNALAAGISSPLSPQEGVNILLHPKNSPFGDKAIALGFQLSQDSKTLFLNDFVLHPRPPILQGEEIGAALITPAETLSDFSSLAHQELLTNVHTRVMVPSDGSDARLFAVYVQTLAVSDIPVEVDDIFIQLLQDADGVLSISSIKTVDRRVAITSPSGTLLQPVCADGLDPWSVLCRVRNMIHSFVMSLTSLHAPAPTPGPRRTSCNFRNGKSSMRNAMALTRPPIRGGPAKFWRGDMNGASRPLPIVGEQMAVPEIALEPSNEDLEDGILNTISNIVIGILIPALIGVAAGIMAGMSGLLIGTLVAWGWIKFVRGGRRGNASQSGAETDVTSANAAWEEKDVLINEEEVSEETIPSARATSRFMSEFSGRSDGTEGYAESEYQISLKA